MGARNFLEKFADGFTEKWIEKDELIAYWRNISYDLTAEHLEGLRLFYRLAAELGLIDVEPPLRLFPD